MTKLNKKRIKEIIDKKEHGFSTKFIARKFEISDRRVQQIYRYKVLTGNMPELKKNRRPRTELTEEDKELIDKAVEDSKLNSTVKIRLYIARYFNRKLPYGKIHKYLLSQDISKPDKKKQKQRKYCRYERKHSFSLGHMDWHESKIIKGKWVCAWEDDASRKILAGDEFDNATTENSKKIVKKAMKVAWKNYSAFLMALNTDKGSQFFSNKHNDSGERGIAEFEKFLHVAGIKHIPSRRNHPQTNGKEERWFRTYNEKRREFNTFKEFVDWYNNTIHLGLNRKEGITPNEAVLNKLRSESLLGLFFRRLNNEAKK